MQLEQQVVSLELAKRLKKLGVKQESLFYHQITGTEQIISRAAFELSATFKPPLKARWFSAFTVAELGEMLPNKYWTVHYDMGWVCRNFSASNKKYHSEIDDTEVGAKAKMLIYLLENKLITL